MQTAESTPTKIEIEMPQPTELVAQMASVVSLAKSFEVTDIESDRVAQEYGQKLRRAEKTWTDYCEPTRKALDVAKKNFLAMRDGILGPWSQARSIFFAKSDAYQTEQRRKAQEEERRLQEEARRQEEDRKLADAIEAEERGEAAEAESILEERVETPVITVAPQIAKVEGVSTRTLYEPEITDVRACLRYLLDRPEWAAVLDRFIPVLVTILRPFATAQRTALSIPGVQVVSKTSRASR